MLPTVGEKDFWLDTVTRANGTLEFVRGSHLWYDEPMERTPIFGDRNGLPQDVEHPSPTLGTVPNQPNIDGCREDFDIISWDLKPGDVLIFQALIWIFYQSLMIYLMKLLN